MRSHDRPCRGARLIGLLDRRGVRSCERPGRRLLAGINNRVKSTVRLGRVDYRGCKSGRVSTPHRSHRWRDSGRKRGMRSHDRSCRGPRLIGLPDRRGVRSCERPGRRLLAGINNRGKSTARLGSVDCRGCKSGRVSTPHRSHRWRDPGRKRGMMRGMRSHDRPCRGARLIGLLDRRSV